MACYEVASLRLALHNLLGNRPPHERTHEEEELGPRLDEPGPLKALANATSLADMRAALDAAGLELEQRVADMPADAPQLGFSSLPFGDVDVLTSIGGALGARVRVGQPGEA